MSDEAVTRGRITGRCACGGVRYALDDTPLFTHVCHCLDCQRRTGSAFSMTTIVLRRDVRVTQGDPSARQTSPRSSAYRCARCDTTIFVASTAFPYTYLLRPSTLDDPRVAPPQAHIWVRRKQAWLLLPEGVPQFDEGYDRDTTWPAQSLARLTSAERA